MLYFMFGDGPKKCNWIEICYSFFVVAALFSSSSFFLFFFFFFARGSNQMFYFTFTAQAYQFTHEEMTEVLILQAWVGLDFLANVAKGWVSSCLKIVKLKKKSLRTDPFTDCASCLQTNFFPVPAIIDLPFWYKCCPYTKSKSAGNLLIPGDNVEETVQVNGLCKSSA